MMGNIRNSLVIPATEYSYCLQGYGQQAGRGAEAVKLLIEVFSPRNQPPVGVLKGG